MSRSTPNLLFTIILLLIGTLSFVLENRILYLQKDKNREILDNFSEYISKPALDLPRWTQFQ